MRFLLRSRQVNVAAGYCFDLLFLSPPLKYSEVYHTLITEQSDDDSIDRNAQLFINDDGYDSSVVLCD